MYIINLHPKESYICHDLRIARGRSMYNVSLLACKLTDVGIYPSQRFSSDNSLSDEEYQIKKFLDV